MSKDPITKINRAVDDCLRQCTSSPSPFSELRGFLKELEEAGGWLPEEISRVEQAVLRVLNDS